MIDACPNSSPGPSRSRTRPSWMTSTDPLRTTQRYSTGPAPCEKIVFPRGMTSVSVTAATRARASAPPASKGGNEPRKPAMPPTGSDPLASAGHGYHVSGPVLGQHRRRPAVVLHQVVDDAHAAEQAGEGRSEEHTSELQSPM